MFSSELGKIKAKLKVEEKCTITSIICTIAKSASIQRVIPKAKDINALEIKSSELKDLIRSSCSDEETRSKLEFFVKFLAYHTKACINIKELDIEDFKALRQYVKATAGIVAKPRERNSK